MYKSSNEIVKYLQNNGSKLLHNYAAFQQLSTSRIPVIVRYFSVDKRKSTTDDLTGQTKATHGKDSPYVYKEINNFIIYIDKDVKFQTMNYEVNEEFALMNTDEHMEGVAEIPSAFQIEPQINDFFVFEIENFDYLVMRVKNIRTNSQFYNRREKAFEIEYSQMKQDIDSLHLKVSKKIFFKYNFVSDIVTFSDTNEDILIENKNKFNNLLTRLIGEQLYDYDRSVLFSNMFIDLPLNVFAEDFVFMDGSQPLKINKELDIFKRIESSRRTAIYALDYCLEKGMYPPGYMFDVVETKAIDGVVIYNPFTKSRDNKFISPSQTKRLTSDDVSGYDHIDPTFDYNSVMLFFKSPTNMNDLAELLSYRFNKNIVPSPDHFETPIITNPNMDPDNKPEIDNIDAVIEKQHFETPIITNPTPDTVMVPEKDPEPIPMEQAIPHATPSAVNQIVPDIPLDAKVEHDLTEKPDIYKPDTPVEQHIPMRQPLDHDQLLKPELEPNSHPDTPIQQLTPDLHNVNHDQTLTPEKGPFPVEQHIPMRQPLDHDLTMTPPIEPEHKEPALQPTPQTDQKTPLNNDDRENQKLGELAKATGVEAGHLK